MHKRLFLTEMKNGISVFVFKIGPTKISKQGPHATNSCKTTNLVCMCAFVYESVCVCVCVYVMGSLALQIVFSQSSMPKNKPTQRTKPTDIPTNGLTNGLTNGWTNQWTDQPTNGRTQPLVELLFSIKHRSVLKISADCMPELAIGNLLS